SQTILRFAHEGLHLGDTLVDETAARPLPVRQDGTALAQLEAGVRQRGLGPAAAAAVRTQQDKAGPGRLRPVLMSHHHRSGVVMRPGWRRHRRVILAGGACRYGKP
ncbi:MAG: hypothetical protein ACK559_05210, partial [bacterium]